MRRVTYLCGWKMFRSGQNFCEVLIDCLICIFNIEVSMESSFKMEQKQKSGVNEVKANGGVHLHL